MKELIDDHCDLSPYNQNRSAHQFKYQFHILSRQSFLLNPRSFFMFDDGLLFLLEFMSPVVGLRFLRACFLNGVYLIEDKARATQGGKLVSNLFRLKRVYWNKKNAFMQIRVSRKEASEIDEVRE